MILLRCATGTIGCFSGLACAGLQRLGVLCVVLLFTIFFSPPAYAQTHLFFRPVGANFDTLTAYAGERPQDTISVYFRKPDEPLNAELVAERDDGAVAKYVISRYKSTGWTGRFEKLDSAESVVVYNFTAQEPGGYELLSIVGSDTLRKVLWVFVDDVVLRDILVENTCRKLGLSLLFSTDYGTIRYDKFRYYDLSLPTHRERQDLGKMYFKNIFWTASVSGYEGLMGPRVSIEDPPPLEEVSFGVKVENIFGRQATSQTPLIEPIAVLPKLQVEMVKEPHIEPRVFTSAGDNPQGPMPFIIRLLSDTKNADSLYWTIRNDRRAVRFGAPDTLFFRGTLEGENAVEPSFEIFSAGLYTAILQVKNTRSGCIDTSMVRLQVDSSLISPQAIPNVFSPNGDGLNDVFRFLEPEKNVRSIRSFELTILNRNGQRIYSYRGEPLLWEGWNGKKRGDGGDASPGVYFYVIRAEGWDGKSFKSEEYKGVLHLFR